MNEKITRRTMIGTLGTAAVGATWAHAEEAKQPRMILGISCSPRPGKATAESVKTALDAAATVSPVIKTELIDLGGMNIGGWNGESFPKDDFQKILPKLKEPEVAGIIIGSPVYFRMMSALCKAFIEQCGVLRKPTMLLANKPIGALAVGKSRNGGQELVIQQIQTAMLCHETLIVGGAHPSFQGGILVCENDSVAGDELGMASAKQLGRRVAEVALL